MSEHSGGIGDQPVEPEFIEKMNATARGLDEIFNGPLHGTDRPVGFVLMVFNMNEIGVGRCNYISNCQRDSVLVMLKEQVVRFEGMAEQTGHA